MRKEFAAISHSNVAWEWLDEMESALSDSERDDDRSSNTELTDVHESDNESDMHESEDDDGQDPFDRGFVTHTMFKCIGATRDDGHQEALQAAAKKLKGGYEVCVQLQPKADNPVDSNAIAFQCRLENEWKRIGFVVQEALGYVHNALQQNTITSVKFSWVKFLLCWSHSGPGFYAGIAISKKGEWSKTVMCCASTR